MVIMREKVKVVVGCLGIFVVGLLLGFGGYWLYSNLHNASFSNPSLTNETKVQNKNQTNNSTSKSSENNKLDESQNKSETEDNLPSTSTVNTLTETQALVIVENLRSKLASYFFELQDIKYSTDYDTYIENDFFSDCQYGMGCMPITNWDYISSLMTNNFLVYLQDNDNAYNFNIQYIDGEFYIIDGTSTYGFDFKNPSIVSLSDDKIICKTTIEQQEDERTVSKNAMMIIKKENNTWKVDELIF